MSEEQRYGDTDTTTVYGNIDWGTVSNQVYSNYVISPSSESFGGMFKKLEIKKLVPHYIGYCMKPIEHNGKKYTIEMIIEAFKKFKEDEYSDWSLHDGFESYESMGEVKQLLFKKDGVKVIASSKKEPEGFGVHFNTLTREGVLLGMEILNIVALGKECETREDESPYWKCHRC